MDPLVTDPQGVGDLPHRRPGSVQPSDRLVELRTATIHLLLELTKVIAGGLRCPEEAVVDFHGRLVY